MVSGVVLDNFGTLVPETMDVIISCKGREVMRIKTRGGMFSCDLRDLLLPSDRVTISILPGPQESSRFPEDQPNDSEIDCQKERDTLTLDNLPPLILSFPHSSWSGGSKEIVLEDAQNVTVTVQYSPFLYNYHMLATSGAAYGSGWVILNPSFSMATFTIVTTKVVKAPKSLDQSCTDRPKR